MPSQCCVHRRVKLYDLFFWKVMITRFICLRCWYRCSSGFLRAWWFLIPCKVVNDEANLARIQVRKVVERWELWQCSPLHLWAPIARLLRRLCPTTCHRCRGRCRYPICCLRPTGLPFRRLWPQWRPWAQQCRCNTRCRFQELRFTKVSSHQKPVISLYSLTCHVIPSCFLMYMRIYWKFVHYCYMFPCFPTFALRR